MPMWQWPDQNVDVAAPAGRVNRAAMRGRRRGGGMRRGGGAAPEMMQTGGNMAPPNLGSATRFLGAGGPAPNLGAAIRQPQGGGFMGPGGFIGRRF